MIACVDERGETVGRVQETVCRGWKCALIDSVGCLRVHLTPSEETVGVTHTLLSGEGIRVPKGLWHATWGEGRTVYVIQEASDTGPLNTETIPAWPLAGQLT